MGRGRLRHRTGRARRAAFVCVAKSRAVSEGTTMSHEGKTQITFIFTASPSQVAEGDRIFASHAAWMEPTHHREGELALLLYNVVKGAELSNPLDPSSAPTENTCFVLTEVYETPAGLADHWKRGAADWGDFGGFAAWASSVKVAVLHGSPVVHSLW